MLKDYNQYQILKDANSSNKLLVDNIISWLYEASKHIKTLEYT